MNYECPEANYAMNEWILKLRGTTVSFNVTECRSNESNLKKDNR